MSLKEYKDLEKELDSIRKKYKGIESEEEDIHLEKMDKCWNKLTDREVALLRLEYFRGNGMSGGTLKDFDKI
jgi:hypothetical protein